MNSRERTVDFIKNKTVDKIPFHPIIMRFAAKYADVKYSDFCLDYKTKCKAMIKCAEDFDIDWVTVMSDPYAEASAYGMEFEYPDYDLPKPKSDLIQNIDDINKLEIVDIGESPRLLNRIYEIEEYKKTVGDEYFVVGWVEGPLGEYADIRGFTNACIDLYDYPDEIDKATDIIVENSLYLITAQIDAGADCIGIGDAVCSQINPRMYRRLFAEKEKILIDHIHSMGALAKLHICGNTSRIQPDMIKTGADIIDVDHLVGSMKPYKKYLGEQQVFSGNTDPVRVIQDGEPDEIINSVKGCFGQTAGRTIISAGCEITPETKIENLKVYSKAAMELT
ncbi:MAG: uroporphyrinogen decarboxylase family protein [Victivallales bacterium]|nr:uroporphyrinogen decarboxylase family protein [Victivallales bacterium]